MIRYGVTAECTLGGDVIPDLGEMIGPLMEALIARGAEDAAVSTAGDRASQIAIDLSVVAADAVKALDRGITIVGGAVIDMGGYIERVEKELPPPEAVAYDKLRQALDRIVEHARWSVDPYETMLANQ